MIDSNKSYSHLDYLGIQSKYCARKKILPDFYFSKILIKLMNVIAEIYSLIFMLTDRMAPCRHSGEIIYIICKIYKSSIV